VPYPNDADGDVLRRMRESGFDFDKPATIDFSIDFDHWPLSDDEVSVIKKAFPNAVLIDPESEDGQDGSDIGYVQFQVTEFVTYELVTAIQYRATKIARPIGGWCESWGVLQE
jgi:hypothetical protein